MAELAMTKRVMEKSPYRVLCVCLGNICRSPTAEVILKHHIQLADLSIEVDSAGTSNYHPDKPPDLRSQKYARAKGYDLSRLRARQVQLEDFESFDLILAMDEVNLSDLKWKINQLIDKNLLHPSALDRVALMSKHDPIYNGQALPDPYFGHVQDFERVIAQCESSAKGWVDYWQANPQRLRLRV